METTTQPFTNDIAPAKPQFLRVLCILTWVCCGLMFLSSLSSLVMQPSPEQQEEQIAKMRELSPEAAEKMEAVLSHQSSSQRMIDALINIVAIALSAFGAVLMWRLKKTGFYLYIVGELLPYLALALGGAEAISAVTSMAGGMGSAIAGTVIGVMVLFDLVFIILYAVNLKYMTK